jgi:hypothetical protein
MENLVLFWKPVSYCPTLILWNLENFTKLFEWFWSIFAKDINGIRKQKRKRRQGNKNIKRTQGHRFGPLPERARGPGNPPPESARSSSALLADRWTPLSGSSSTSSRYSSLQTVELISPFIPPLLPCPFCHTPTPIKAPDLLPHLPFRSSARGAAKTEEFLVGGQHVCELVRPNSPLPMNPARSSLS